MISSSFSFLWLNAGKVPKSAKQRASITELFPDPIIPSSAFTPLENVKSVSEWERQFCKRKRLIILPNIPKRGVI